MKKLFLMDGNKPEWVIEQESKGNVVVCNAPRPLYGDETDDSWCLPYFHGRHYAALNPSDNHFQKRMELNEQQDARQLVFVTKDQAVETGINYYREELPTMVSRIDTNNPEHIELLAKKGIERLNGKQI